MSDINLIVTVTREQQCCIEEHCINSGQSLSQYLIGLHNIHQDDLGKPRKWASPTESRNSTRATENFGLDDMEEVMTEAQAKSEEKKLANEELKKKKNSK